MNTCKPMNNQTLSDFLDVSIFLENNKYVVMGITDSFKSVTLGEYDFILDAYGCALKYGFELYEYNVAISPLENKVVSFTLD